MKRFSPIEELKEGLLFDPKDGFFNGVQTNTIRDFHIGMWYNPIEYYLGGGYYIDDGAGMPWTVDITGNKKQLRYPCEARRAVSTMQYGENEWCDYTVEVTIASASGIDFTGLAFRYQHSRSYYALVAGRYDTLRVVHRNQNDWTVLCDGIPLPCSEIAGSIFTIQAKGNHFICSLNGKEVYQFTDDTYKTGSVALITYSEAAFCDMRLDLSEEEQHRTEIKKEQNRTYVAKKAENFPLPRLYHSFSTPVFGSSESRIIKSENRIRCVFVQSQKLRPDPNTGNVFDNITCITVTDDKGDILWQIGTPGIASGNAACYQVYDLDGDGKLEMIATKDFEILLIDFETGKIKDRCRTPEAPRFAVPYTDGAEDFFPHICGDAITIADTSGNGKIDGFTIKDRYNNIWGYDKHLKQLWTQHLVTGHFPFPYDINGDGVNEILIGHTCLSADGKILWHMPLSDHVDQMCADHFDGGKDLQIAFCAGEEGFILTNAYGKILHKPMLGHVQKMCVGHLSPKHENMQFMLYTLWGDQGILYSLDSAANVVSAKQLGHNCRLRAANWEGRGTANAIFDVKGRFDTAFYDFELNHLCGFDDLPEKNVRYGIGIADLMGDSRDEIILTSPREVLFYTQSDNGRPDIIEMKNDMHWYNHSGYRCDKYLRK